VKLFQNIQQLAQTTTNAVDFPNHNDIYPAPAAVGHEAEAAFLFG